MNFSEKINIRSYGNKAKDEFNSLKATLDDVLDSFETRMDGRTTGSLVGAIIVNVLWLALFGTALFFAWDYLDLPFILVSVGIGILLILVMIIDNVLNISYYGKISNYVSRTEVLYEGVNYCSEQIDSLATEFENAASQGWNYALEPGDSVYDKTENYRNSVEGISTFSGNFLNGLKNVLYFLACAGITFAGCYAVYPFLYSFIYGIESSIKPEYIQIGAMIAYVIAAIIHIVLARLVWSKTDCSVNNVTLLMLLTGVPIFLALIAVVTLVVLLIIALIYIAIGIAVVAVGILILSATCGDG